MTIYDRFLARRLVASLLKISLALVLIIVVIDLLTHRSGQIIEYEVPSAVVAMYYLGFVPAILFTYQVAAIAMLVSGLMVLGKAAEQQEITALLAGGTSLWRISLIPVAVAVFLMGLSFGLQETVGVKAAALTEKIEDEYFSRAKSNDRKVVSWANLQDTGSDAGGTKKTWTCHIMKFNRQALTGQDVYLHARSAEEWEEIRTQRIYWDDSQQRWFLEGGRWTTIFSDREGAQRNQLITQIPAPFAEKPADLFALETSTDTKSFWKLARDLTRAEKLKIPVQRYWVDYHVKFARPALCFVMIFLAIPFAIRLRRGGFAVGVGLSIAIGLAYLMVFYMSMGLGHLGKLSPIVAAWFPNVFFLLIGLGLLKKTPT
jgi:lipopolysaccharide export system permease protein